MRVKMENGLTFDMGLTGKEHQDTFSDEKYRALAGGSPQGKTLQVLVEDRWLEWLEIVETAPWLRNWLKSPFYCKKSDSLDVDEADSPSGEHVDGASRFKQRKIASALYAEAVWGYGMADWLRGKHNKATADAKTKSNPALRTIYNLQNLRYPNSSRNYTWDDKIYRGCGMLVPSEFGELDRWLDPLWVEAQDRTAAHLATVQERFQK